MEELFIRLKNGVPSSHPIFAQNMREAFPNIDFNNLPPEFARFVSKESPPLETWADMPYKVMGNTYVKEGDVWTNFWELRDCTDEERVQLAASKKVLVDQDVDRFRRTALESIADPAVTDKARWEAYVTILDNFTYDDPYAAVIPLPPLVRDGELITTDSPGSAPNVTG